MKFVLGLVGLVLGALGGELFGAIVGALLGFAVGALMWPKKPAAVGNPEPSGVTASSPLEQRVAQLEHEVAALHSQVRRLEREQAASPLSTAAAPAELSQPAAPTAFDLPPSQPAVATEAATTRVPLTADAAPPELLKFDFEPLPATEEEPATMAATAPLANASESHVNAPAPAPAVPLRPQPAHAKDPAPSLQDRLPPFISRWVFGGNTIVKVGVLILFLGLAFLLRYAAERVTVPVELRYAGVALFGAALMGLGWRLRERLDKAGGSGYGLILQGAGIGVFYLTTLSALKLSHLLPPELAFAFLFGVAVLSAVLAVAQNAPWLAYVAAIEGFAAPVLVSTGSGNHIALFSYLAILDLGIFCVAWFKAWRPLNLIGFVGTFALAGAWADKHYTATLYPSTQFFLLLFFALFTAIGVLFARRALATGDAGGAGRPLSLRAAEALKDVGRVDSALVFGVPLASYGLQHLLVKGDAFGPAWASFGFALFYLLLGGTLMRSGHVRYSLLGEAYAIVSVIFGTLTIPLALEGEWTGATWAIEAAGMFWLGTRQHRPYARAFGLAVLVAASLQLVDSLGVDSRAGMPLLTGSVLGMALLATSALAMFGVSRRAQPEPTARWEAAGSVATLWIGLAALASIPWLTLLPTWASAVMAAMGLAVLWPGLRKAYGPVVVAWAILQLAAGLSFLIVGPALWAEPVAGTPQALTLWVPLLLTFTGLLAGDALQSAAKQASAAPWLRKPALHWAVVAWSLLWWTQVLPPDGWRTLLMRDAWLPFAPALLALWVTLSSLGVSSLARWRGWALLGQTSALTVPGWVLAAWMGPALTGAQPALHLGWLAWPFALAWHLVLLRAQPRWLSTQWLKPLHVVGFWLFVLLATRQVQAWTTGWGEPGSTWPALGWALVPAAVLALISRPRLLARWPLSAFRDTYLLAACAPVALYLLLWLWVSNALPGTAAPLPYVPLLNPLELAQGLVLLAMALWYTALPLTPNSPRSGASHRVVIGGLGVVAFALYTGMVLRTCHHWAGVDWNVDALFDSTLTQAALSVAWSLVGVALMLLGHRRLHRLVWGVGAGLLGVVVVKLFFVELADSGGLYRIVSFIVVGLLLLLVGYFAPVPPSRGPQTAEGANA